MRAIHREALDRFDNHLATGPAVLRKAWVAAAEAYLDDISRAPFSKLLLDVTHPVRVEKAAGGRNGLFEFMGKRLQAELDIRLPPPPLELA